MTQENPPRRHDDGTDDDDDQEQEQEQFGPCFFETDRGVRE